MRATPTSCVSSLTDRLVARPSGSGGRRGRQCPRVTGLYGVAPSVEFVEIAQIVDNSRA